VYELYGLTEEEINCGFGLLGFERERPSSMTNKDKIIAKALDFLKAVPKGMRYTMLVEQISAALPDIPKNTIHGTIWNLDVQIPDKISKPVRGLYLLTEYSEKGGPEPPHPPVRVKEEEFYESFADWLVNELEECTKAIAVGGNVFKDKWGTPDVIGIREPKKSDIVKLTTEIVSAEIKLDTSGLITAFGQACAYRLFSHKSYIVVPVNSSEDDIARLDALSRIFGIGLILFNSAEPKTPDYEIRVRATKHEPDMFYVNRSMKLIEDDLFS
jgi:hypothetical protein